jgi:hypothetical protein
MNRPTVSEIIDDIVKVQYVRKHPGLGFCHHCLATLIANDVELKKRAKNVSGTPLDYNRGFCSRCGNLGTTIAFHQPE